MSSACQSCAGLTRELNIALYSHIQVNKAVYGYVQDRPDTFLVLRRIDQGAIYSYMKVSVPLYGYIQDLPDTLSILRRTDQGAIYGYIHPYTGKYSFIWLYTGPSRHLVSPAQD